MAPIVVPPTMPGGPMPQQMGMPGMMPQSLHHAPRPGMGLPGGLQPNAGGGFMVPQLHQRQELPPGASNLLVLTGIPTEAKENDVKVVCQGAGGGEVIKISYRVADQDGLGWAFVVFATPEQAHNARDRLDGKTLGGYIFKKPLSASIGEGVFGEVKKAKPEDVTAGEWKEFKTPDGRAYWHNKTTKQTTWTRPAPIQMVSPLAASAATKSALNSGPLGANLFVYHVPNSWDDGILKQHFEHFGKIVSCAIQRGPDGTSKGYGFISFETQQAAKAAISGMNGFPVEGKWLKVQLKKGDEEMMNPGGNDGPVASSVPALPAPSEAGFGPMKPGMVTPRPGPY